MRRNLATLLLTFSALTLLATGISTTYGQPMPQPTSEHQALQLDAGVWDAEVKLWVTPDSDPITGTAIETNRKLGGMWILSDFEGEFGGFPFSGQGQHGYDPVKKKYVGTWIDSVNPYLSVYEGTMDKTGTILTMMSKGTDPETKQPSVTKMVMTQIGPDKKKFEMFTPNREKKGKWDKNMEINYTRQK